MPSPCSPCDLQRCRADVCRWAVAARAAGAVGAVLLPLHGLQRLHGPLAQPSRRVRPAAGQQPQPESQRSSHQQRQQRRQFHAADQRPGPAAASAPTAGGGGGCGAARTCPACCARTLSPWRARLPLAASHRRRRRGWINAVHKLTVDRGTHPCWVLALQRPHEQTGNILPAFSTSALLL